MFISAAKRQQRYHRLLQSKARKPSQMTSKPWEMWLTEVVNIHRFEMLVGEEASQVADVED